ncbi:MAG: TraR/DksA C4-type zinc finger protein [Candidatus Falkowbacteria bacterium]
MDQKIIDRIKSDLLDRKKQLETELDDFTSHDPQNKDEHITEFPNYGDQYDENAQEVSQYTTDLETERVLDGTLKDINSALKAIETGTYGICKYCNKEIEEKRLLIRPFSSACVSCKTKLQQS